MHERGSEAWARWKELLTEQAGSGLSVAAFCRQHRLTESQFYAWKRRLRQAAVERFVEVQVVKPAADLLPGRSPAIEIRLGSGRRVFVELGFDAHHLRAVLAALEEPV
jgi:hypothetical protein